MNRQYCKVGAVKPLRSGASTQALLEEHYKVLIGRASEPQSLEAGLQDFFEAKAKKIRRVLEALV